MRELLSLYTSEIDHLYTTRFLLIIIGKTKIGWHIINHAFLAGSYNYIDDWSKFGDGSFI